MTDTDKNTIENNLIHIVYKLPPGNVDVLKHKSKPQISDTMEYPLFSNGFQHFIHANKDKMEITRNFDGRKKVYNVINPYEPEIDEYDGSISHQSTSYFGLKQNGPGILDREFYNLWELLFMFDIVTPESSITSVHLSDGPGGFLQSTLYYKTKFGKSKNDKYYVATKHPEEDGLYTPEIDSTFINYYSKMGIKMNVHKTYNKKNATGSKDNGDLSTQQAIDNIVKEVGSGKADFVTANGKIHPKNDNTEEQEILPLIIGEIIAILRLQKQDGSCVIRFAETFTNVTLNIIHLLSVCYNDVFIAKPFMSKQSNPDRYIICKGFKFKDNDKGKLSIISNLETILMETTKKNKFVVEIYPNFSLPKLFTFTMLKANTDIGNRELININEIVDFIKGENYYGDVYQQKRDDQISHTKAWLNKFFPNASDFKKAKSKNLERTDDIISYNNNRVKVISAQIH
jgi:hypothetical protein